MLKYDDVSWAYNKYWAWYNIHIKHIIRNHLIYINLFTNASKQCLLTANPAQNSLYAVKVLHVVSVITTCLFVFFKKCIHWKIKVS